MLDIFDNDAFSVIQLTGFINQLKFVPGRLGRMGLFEGAGVYDTHIGIDMVGDTLVLIPPTARGGPGTTIGKETGSMLDLRIPHFEINDAVMAEEVQGKRELGTENGLRTLQSLVARRLTIHNNSWIATEEHQRVGAIKGIITYADNSTLDLYATFGVQAESEIDMDLDAASPVAGVLRKKCAGIIRQMAGILDGLTYSGIYAFCGDAFFDDLIAHKEVRETYLQQQEASQLRNSYINGGFDGSYGSFNFGGITWDNYRGGYNGTPFIHTDKCHFVPMGVPGLFKTYWAPADYNETVNTLGQRLYVKQWPMPNDKGRNMDSQMNALHICTRPKVLIQGKRT
jgi:Phage major capsid protein E